MNGFTTQPEKVVFKGEHTLLKFYHVTLAENIASLLSNGADPSRIGENSLKAGSGFHLTPRYAWAEEWGRILFPSPLDRTAILQVTLPERGTLDRWGKAQGYLERDGSPSGKLLQVAHEENWPEDSDYFLDAMNGRCVLRTHGSIPHGPGL